MYMSQIIREMVYNSLLNFFFAVYFFLFIFFLVFYFLNFKIFNSYMHSQT